VVVHKEPAPIVFRAGLREGWVMYIAPTVVAEHLLRRLVEAVTRSGIRCENGNRDDVPHGGNPRDKDLSRVSAGIEEVVFIFLTWGDVGSVRVCLTLVF